MRRRVFSLLFNHMAEMRVLCDDRYGLGWSVRQPRIRRLHRSGFSRRIGQESAPVTSMEPITPRQVVNSWCFPPVYFFSAASAAAGEAPLLAGEALCGEARSYVYTCEPLLWFANVATFCRESAGAPRLVCPAVAALRQGTVVDDPLTLFLGGGCAIGRLRSGASGRRPAPRNSQTG